MNQLRKYWVHILSSVCAVVMLAWMVLLIPHLFVIGQAYQLLAYDYVEGNDLNAYQMFDKTLVGMQSALFDSEVSLSEGAIESMLELIDDKHTRYLPPTHYSNFTDNIDGSFIGVGIRYTVDEAGDVVVLSTFSNSPAQKEGILSGDIILAIDGQSTAGMTTSDVSEAMVGDIDTEVVLSILHEGETDPVTILITRDEISVPIIMAEEIEDDIIYIRIDTFTTGSGTEFKTKLGNRLNANPDTIGIIIDVRSNPGGAVSDVVTICSQFLDFDEPVIHQTDADFNITRTYTAESGGVATNSDLRLAVLQNADSASASEVLSAVLQEQANAEVIGTTSYGKGSINHAIQLFNGSALYISTAYWTTPDGQFFGDIGITPDIEVQDVHEQLNTAIEYIRNTP
ncbi:MAG: S41 family peptidase [Chloroflexi bacterium]|jgi:carboxyl-terminal processing protease|nr:S41 family peptidase [Chloroflexota bacterium]MBT7080391.1 S41 family peptidase [Chloroflexota bacterium]MBT7289440.1 S41 family peptidase [Chloroflexota bacterium]